MIKLSDFYPESTIWLKIISQFKHTGMLDVAFFDWGIIAEYDICIFFADAHLNAGFCAETWNTVGSDRVGFCAKCDIRGGAGVIEVLGDACVNFRFYMDAVIEFKFFLII